MEGQFQQNPGVEFKKLLHLTFQVDQLIDRRQVADVIIQH